MGNLCRKSKQTSNLVVKVEKDLRFEILSDISSGYTYTVFKARDLTSNEIVALKIVFFKPESKEQKELSVAWEVAMYSTSINPHCPHITPMLSHGVGTVQNDKILFISLKLGISLQTVLNKLGGMPESLIYFVAKDILLGLVELARQNLIHRDIKLSNCILLNNGASSLIDFNLAWEFDKTKRNDKTYNEDLHAQGSKGWRSKEDMNNDKTEEKKGYDVERADVCSFGKVLVCCLFAKKSERNQLSWGLDEKALTCSDTFRVMAETLIQENPDKRPTFEELLNFDWFQNSPFEVNREKYVTYLKNAYETLS